MLNKIIFFSVCLYSLNLLGQNSGCAILNDAAYIEQMSPIERVTYFNTAPTDCEYDIDNIFGGRETIRTNVLNNSWYIDITIVGHPHWFSGESPRFQYLAEYKKYYKDGDNDGFPDDPNDFVYFVDRKTEKVSVESLMGSPIRWTPHYFYDDQYLTNTHHSYNIIDNVSGNITDSFTTRYKTYFYNGYYWVREDYGFDCAINNPNLPIGIERIYVDADNDGYGSNSNSNSFLYYTSSGDPVICGFPKYKAYNCTYQSPYVGISYSYNNDDCNDYSDDVTTQPIYWYPDFDEDGYGRNSQGVLSCDRPTGTINYVTNSDDCNDYNSNYNVVDIIWYADLDEDGFGDPNNTLIATCPPLNYVTGCYFDDCPTEAGTRTNGCPVVEYDFDNENKNYTYERVYVNEFEPEELINADSQHVIEQISYSDGLGRSKQQNSIGSSPLGNDIVLHHEYDENGHKTKTYLPYISANTNGFYDESSLINTLNYYNTAEFENTSNPYAENILEKSPLNRVKEKAQPGFDWQYNEDNVSYINMEVPIDLDFSTTLEASLFPIIDDDYTDGQVNLNINNTSINIEFDLRLNESALQVGQIAQLDLFPYMLDDYFIGQLSDDYGTLIPYFVQIQNNYLVITSTDPDYGVRNIQCEFHIGVDIPFAQYEIEQSLNNTIKYEYGTNLESSIDEIKYFSVQYSSTIEEPELMFMGYYTPYSLKKSIIKNENWQPNQNPNIVEKNNTIETYKNGKGQVILKRAYDNNLPHDTYYVYDEVGNLNYVIPPTASDQINEEGATGFRISSQRNYSWTDLVLVDKNFAEEYNKKLSEYENSEILNTDLVNEYGGQGGFTITTHENQDLVTLSVTFSADTPFALKQGELVSLKEYGEYKDTELGEIKGPDFSYVFLIKNNTIIIEKSGKGEGKLTSVNQSFNSNIKLSYSQNYPWTTYTDVDSKFAADYEKQLGAYPNSDILGVNIPNEYGGQGGLNISIDEYDNILLTFNSSTTTPLKLKQGLVIPLNAKRKIDDRDSFETFQGYTLSIKDNNLHIVGKQALTSFIRTCGTPIPTIPPATVEGLCYIYHYDYLNRIIEKKIPGKDWEFIVYDKLDRPILTQDANLRLENKWLFTKYDAFSRVVYTGIYTIISTSTTTRLQLQNQVNNQINPQWYETRTASTIIINTVEIDTETNNPLIYYSNNSFPKENLEVLTINYYDDYEINLDTALDYQDSYGQELSVNNKTMPTVSKIRVLDTNDWITSASYFDNKSRPIFAVSKNEYLNTLDWSKIKLDFIGKVVETTTQHQKTGETIIETVDTYTYDHMSRLLSLTQSINNGTPELIVNNHFNELGQLVSKNVGGSVATLPENSTGLQTIDFSYNIRGWLKSINNGTTLGDDLFGIKLNYNSIEQSDSKALYNGNVSEIYWETANDNNQRNYSYYYDALSRIKQAKYNSNYALDSNPTEFENFSVEKIKYDKNGNIYNLRRYGTVGNSNQVTDIIDILHYTYAPKSNKLMSVSDTGSPLEGFKDKNTYGDDYNYDSNGNLTLDKNKNIVDIKYNHLNLPTKIDFSFSETESITQGKIEYVYDATGNKLQKKVSQSGPLVNIGQQSTLYAGNYIYNGYTGNESLKFFSHPEGYVEPDNNNFNYIYQYKDQLGSVRLSYSDFNDNNSVDASEIIEENNFYPFGMMHKGYSNVISANSNEVASKFKFNGIELEESLEVNNYEMHFRHYDPTIARFTAIDPVTHFSMSTYTAFDNNPVFWRDPSGADSYGGYYGTYDLEWGGYMMDRGDPGYSDEGQNYGSPVDGIDFMFLGLSMMSEIEINVKYTGWRIDDSYLDDMDNERSLGYRLDKSDALGLWGTDNENTDNLELNSVSSVGLSTGFALIGGFTIGLGFTVDAQDNWGMYFDFKGNMGFGASTGLDISVTKPVDKNHKISINDLNGESGSYNVDLILFGTGLGGTLDPSINGKEGLDPTNFGTGPNGNKTINFGVGPSLGGYYSKEYRGVWDF